MNPQFLRQRHNAVAALEPLHRHPTELLRMPSRSFLGHLQSPFPAKCASSVCLKIGVHSRSLCYWTAPDANPASIADSLYLSGPPGQFALPPLQSPATCSGSPFPATSTLIPAGSRMEIGRASCRERV